MTSRFLDSFDHYNTARIVPKWTALAGSPTIVPSIGRNGTACLQGTGTADYVQKTLDSQSTWIVGFARKAAASVNGTRNALLTFTDTGTNQVRLAINPDNTITAQSWRHFITGDDWVDLGSGGALTTGIYSFIECKVVVNGSAGSVVVRVNGSVVINVTGVQTDFTGSNTANAIAIDNYSAIVPVTVQIDDVYIFDGTGALNNDFAGDCAIQAYLANSAGAYAQFTPVGASPNINCVKENPPDDDTTYNSSVTPGNKDSFHVAGTIGGSDTIKAAQLVLDARKDNSSNRFLKGLVRQSTTDNVSTLAQGLSTQYAFYEWLYDINPVTGLAWVPADINNPSLAEFGYDDAGT